MMTLVFMHPNTSWVNPYLDTEDYYYEKDVEFTLQMYKKEDTLVDSDDNDIDMHTKTIGLE